MNELLFFGGFERRVLFYYSVIGLGVFWNVLTLACSADGS